MGFKNFFTNKKIFLTGHTGFKGSWLALYLDLLGAEICGYALKPEQESLFNIVNLEQKLTRSIFGDIRNHELLNKEINDFQPDIIIHMAAQPLVRASYSDPRFTYETNVIGTLNVFEAAKTTKSIQSIVNITTDKCYENKEHHQSYSEDDPLGGYDPYSSSKACAEILTSSYRRSFFDNSTIALASARAGNVIGGGDFSQDRIIPDIFRAIRVNKKISLRSPNAIRPWQHVLEPLYGYLILAKNLYENKNKFAKAYNFGPNKDAEVNVENLTKKFIEKIGIGEYSIEENSNLHEAGILKLNHSRAKTELDWNPKLSFEETISWTVDWYKNYLKDPQKIKEFTIQQIKKYDAL